MPASKAEVQASIKELEFTISKLTSPASGALKRALELELESKKISLRAFKTPGQQLDDLRGALERAKKSNVQAEEAFLLATKARQASNEEVADLQSQLDKLEATLAKETVASEPTPTSPLETLRSQLQATVEELRGFRDIEAKVVEDAEAQSAQLLRSFELTLAAAQKAQEGVRKRLPTKRTAEAPVVTRLNGKQTVQSHLSSFFGDAKRVRSTLGTATGGVSMMVLPPSSEMASPSAPAQARGTTAFSPYA